MITGVPVKHVVGVITEETEIGESIQVSKETAHPARQDVAPKTIVEESNVARINVLGGPLESVLLTKNEVQHVLEVFKLA